MTSDPVRNQGRRPRIGPGLILVASVFLLLGVAMGAAPLLRTSASSDLLMPIASGPPSAANDARNPARTTQEARPSALSSIADSSPNLAKLKSPIVEPETPSAAQTIISWAYDQNAPSVAYGSGLNEYLVVWEDHHWGSGADSDIYGRRVNTGGAPVGGAFGISWDGNRRLAPDVVHNYTDQEYLVVWEYEWSTSDHDIYGRRVDYDGTLIPGEFGIATPGAYDRNPVVAYSVYDNSYLVVWERRVGDAEHGQYDIYAQRLDWDGTKLGSEIALDTGTASQEHPAIAYNSSAWDEYLVIWQDKTAGNWDIVGRRVDADGSLLGVEFAIEAPGHDQTWPDIAFNSNRNEYLVVWEDRIGGASSDWDIKAWRRSISGGALTWHLISSSGTKRRMKPAVTYKFDADEYLVTYEYEYSASDLDVAQSRLRWDGLARQTDAVISNAGSTHEARPAVASDGALSNLVVWEDWRNAGSMGIDIYGDRVNAYALSGHVYHGNYPVTSWPLSGVDVALWCSSTAGEWGIYQEGTTTDVSGSYTLVDHGYCAYYNIGEYTPSGYQSTHASSIGGAVMTFDRIQYSGSLEGKTLTGNNFWDAPLPPPPPTSVAASDLTYTDRVRVTWDSAAGATYYEVYRATSAGGSKLLLGSPAGTSYDDTTAAVGTTYYYWVKACHSWDCSGYSAYDTGQRSGTPPAAPTSVAASDLTYTDKVRVTWDSAAGATYYEVYRATSAGGSKSLLGSPTVSPYDDSGAAVGTTYYYWVVACNSWGCSGYSAYDTGERSGTPPAVPTSVAASDLTYTDRVRVTWGAAAGATYYEVYRAASAGGSKSLLGSPTASPYDDSGAAVGVTYYYWVKACNSWGCSGYSAYDTGERSGTPPAPPTSVAASDLTYTDRVRVTWDSAAGATYYEVYRATSAGGSKSLLGSPTVSPYDDSGAAVGVTYYYWVVACNSWGCSDYSAYDTGERSGTPPAPPTSVAASDLTYTDRVRVTWDAAAGATYYEVYRATSAGGSKSLLGSPTVSPYDDSGAAVGVTYYYWVVACNSWGCSDYSAYDTGERSGTPPAPPTSVAASDLTYTDRVRVTWDAAAGATYYEVYRATSAGGSKSLLGSPAVPPYDDSGAAVGTTYYYWVVACNSWGCSDYSAYDTGERSGTPPAPPTSVAASDLTYTDRVRVTWDSSAGATTYEVYRATSAGGSKSLLGSPTVSPYDDSGAAVGTTYYYWVVACNSWGCSDYSAYDTGERSGTPPDPPANVAATDGTYTETVRVTWDAAAGATYYEVYRAESLGGAKSLLDSPTASPYDDSGAAVDTTYYYWVVACNSWGCSDYGAHDTGYRSGIPPEAPANVAASDGTYTETVRVTWDGAAGATYYGVFRAESLGGAKSLLGSPTASPYDDSGAAVGTTFYYWVVACNSWGCSDYGAHDTGYRSGIPPEPPANVAASDGTYTETVRVTWDAASGATYYEVYRAESLGGAKSLLGSPTASPYDDNGAAVGTTYYYWVVACNSWGCSDYGAHDTGYRSGIPPEPPANVAASDGTYTETVRVTWDSAAGATTYEVYRAESLGGAKSLLGSPTASPYDDTSAVVGTTYYYWVVACNSWGCSDYSAYDTGYRSDTPPLTGAVSGRVILERRASNAGAVIEIAGLSVTTGADGVYLLTDVPTGMQTIAVRRDGYLRTWRQELVASGETLNLPDVTLLGGDVDGDDVIGQFDAASISVAWNATPGSPVWIAIADITDDGIINVLDIIAVEYNWGRLAPGPWSGP